MLMPAADWGQVKFFFFSEKLQPAIMVFDESI